MTDRIYVTYGQVQGSNSSIPGSIGDIVLPIGAYHLAIHYVRTDISGQIIEHRVVEAGPATHPPDAIRAVIADYRSPTRNPSPWGNIVIATKGGRSSRNGASDPSLPATVVATGDDLEGYLTLI
jgi:hypothetical protein